MNAKKNTSIALYVSPSGDDSWSGNFPDPSADGTDGPFASLERARDLLRQRRQDGSLQSGATVFIRGGIYARESCFELAAQDSGRSGAPVVYRSYQKETPRLSGGRTIGPFALVEDPDLLRRLPETARSHVLQCDLKKLGIVDFGRFTSRGFGRPTSPAHLELFFQDRRMEVARWPNDDFARIEATAGLCPEGDSHGGELDDLEAGFIYDGDRPGRWQGLEDVWLHGYWAWDWANSYEQLESYDPCTGLIKTRPPHGTYGIKSGQRFYFLNVLEELDRPGEYYLDRASGILYFWPPSPASAAEATVSLLEEPLIRSRDAGHLSIEGLTLECTRGLGIDIAGGSDVTIAGCTLRNIGNHAVVVESGHRHAVVGCDIHHTGDSGIRLSGGDRQTLTPGEHCAVNNHIYSIGEWSRCYQPGIMIQGVGNRIAHNLIHDGPHSGIQLAGNEHLIEFNHIHHVCQESGDVGAFYMGRNWTERGIIIRHNFFHHTQGYGMGSMAVYLDDCASGVTVFGNIFYQCTRAAFIGGGRNNLVGNNIFVDCRPAIVVDGRGLESKQVWRDMVDKTMKESLDVIDHHSPPYSVRYPDLAQLDPYYQAGVGIPPEGNLITRNIFRGGEWLQIHWHADPAVVAVQNNLVDEDPRFVDPEGMDFRLQADSPAYEFGFKCIPVERIGLCLDEYRSDLPSTDQRTLQHG